MEDGLEEEGDENEKTIGASRRWCRLRFAQKVRLRHDDCTVNLICVVWVDVGQENCRVFVMMDR